MNLSYKITESGYQIYLDGRLWIEQGDVSHGFFPNPIFDESGKIDFAKSAEAHIDAIKSSEDEEKSNQSQLDVIEANTSYLVMMSEMEV